MFAHMKMKFGKHAGQLISDVPSSYLHWMLREVKDLDVLTRRAAEDVLHLRGDDAEPEQPRHALPDVRATVKSWYREMALKYHPDRTLDDGTAMRAINHSYERLQELLGLSR